LTNLLLLNNKENKFNIFNINLFEINIYIIQLNFTKIFLKYKKYTLKHYIYIKNNFYISSMFVVFSFASTIDNTGYTEWVEKI